MVWELALIKGVEAEVPGIGISMDFPNWITHRAEVLAPSPPAVKISTRWPSESK